LLNQPRRSLLTQRPSSRGLKLRRASLYSEISAIPFLAIVYTLFIIVMVSKTTYIDLPPDSVNLVKSDHSILMPGALREDRIQINLTMSGDLSLNHNKTDIHSLQGQIQAGLQTGAERKIYLWVDSRTKYGDVTTVLREIRRAGIENVSFITR
jgi:biopolymer transport protein ExbD